MKHIRSGLYTKLKQVLNGKMIECNDSLLWIKIRQTQLDKITNLDLSNCNVTSTISISKYFKNLKSLNLRGNKIIEIQDLKHYQYLETLDLRDITPSNGGKLDITPLKLLQNLKTLYINNSKIEDKNVINSISSLKNCDEWTKTKTTKNKKDVTTDNKVQNSNAINEINNQIKMNNNTTINQIEKNNEIKNTNNLLKNLIK